MIIRIDKIVYPGRRLGLAEGKVVFTDRGLPGETVEVEPLRDRGSYLEARTERVIEAAGGRVEPRCGHWPACSPYQDMGYALQLEVKAGQVAEILARELKRPFEAPEIVPSPEVWGYRNKIRLKVAREGGAVTLVYNEPGERASFVAVDRCELVPERVNALIARVRQIVADGPFGSVEAVEVRTSRSSGQSLLALDLASGAEAKALGEALAAIRREHALAGAVASVSDGKRRRDERLFGREFVEETVRGLTFRIGARSFFQANVGILERVLDDMAAAVAAAGAGAGAGRGGAGVEGELAGAGGARTEPVVADLYCGLGLFGAFLARGAREVFGVESEAANAALLKKNLGLNRIGNFAVCEGTTEEWLPEVLDRAPDVVVLDPPRRGVHPSVVAGLAADPAPLVLYLSCNPATLARDLKGLLGAYALAGLRVYDFFPHTPHIESLAILHRGR